MDFLLIFLQPHVMVGIALITVLVALRPHQRARARARAFIQQNSALAVLAESLGGKLATKASAWSPRLQRSKLEPELSLDFQRGPWHVRVTQAFNPRPHSDALLAYEHWIEIATMPVPTRKIPLEFFTLSFEDGFVHVVCQGEVPSDEIVFLVDMILEKLGRVRDVEPRDPSAVV
ncbi:hypothetical protein [Lentzea sp. HUAS12]|uniref:hypothetical protein n=1 Tax=Lentzea sp. HUAS12 TaxID=2951806 RepID=UPI00209EBBD2|nr:hypothetical protein [Lentzea sp. HUAS12]USX49723.1 hypothetical protein ND450_30480 [Lentzea sp. HUAS12]